MRFGGLWPDKPDMNTCHSHESIRHPTHVHTVYFRAPSESILTDLKNDPSDAADVTWILPGPFSSDHPGVPGGNCGPSWVGSVVNAIGEDKDLWKTSVIFIFWDDWGGYYDHQPPYTVRDQAGPGFRVPLLVVSPFVHRGMVEKTNIEFATLLKFAETAENLPSLGGADTAPNLNSVDGFFNFDQEPQPFTPIPVSYPVGCSVKSMDIPAKAAARSRWLRMVSGDD